VPGARYAQFCPLARAAEVVGERWTLLVLRELLCGPQRFSDLRRRLPGVSSSVLAQRLAGLEARGLVERREAPPPAPAALYALTELGEGLRPAALELARFGVRLLGPPRAGEHFEPDWILLGLQAFARRGASPRRRFALRIPTAAGELRVDVAGGRRGTRVCEGEGPAGSAPDATLRADPLTLLGLASGQLPASAAIGEGGVELAGDAAALADLPRLFDLDSLLARPNDAGRPRAGPAQEEA